MDAGAQETQHGTAAAQRSVERANRLRHPPRHVVAEEIGHPIEIATLEFERVVIPITVKRELEARSDAARA